MGASAQHAARRFVGRSCRAVQRVTALASGVFAAFVRSFAPAARVAGARWVREQPGSALTLKPTAPSSVKVAAERRIESGRRTDRRTAHGARRINARGTARERGHFGALQRPPSNYRRLTG